MVKWSKYIGYLVGLSGLLLLAVYADDTYHFIANESSYPIGVNYDSQMSIYASRNMFISYHISGIILSLLMVVMALWGMRIGKSLIFGVLGLNVLLFLYPIVFK